MADLIELAKKLKSEVGKITAELATIDAKIADAQARKDELNGAPVSKADYLGYVRESIRRRGERAAENARRYHRDHGIKTYGALERQMAGNREGLLLPVLNWTHPTAEFSEQAIYFYFGDLIVDRLSEALDHENWPADAVPVEERARLIECIEAEIQELQESRQPFLKQLADAGIS